MSIILDHINYCYSADSAYKVQALKDVSLEINDGEFIGIIGHTGSGKSTLIQHMNGLLKATSGHIYYNGQDIYDNDYDLSKLRHKVGMVFQYPEHQLFETTIFDDVCFGPKNQGLSKEEAGLRAFEALRSVGMPEELYYQSPFDLSEFDAVVMPVLATPPKLAYRNLFYTALTRAKKLLVLVGNEGAVRAMVENDKKSRRYSALLHFLTVDNSERLQ